MPKIIWGDGHPLFLPSDPTSPPRKARSCRHITIRLSDDIVRDLKWMAWGMDVQYQALLKILLYEKVSERKLQMMETEKRLSDILSEKEVEKDDIF